jgi:hypothetical protein
LQIEQRKEKVLQKYLQTKKKFFPFFVMTWFTDIKQAMRILTFDVIFFRILA